MTRTVSWWVRLLEAPDGVAVAVGQLLKLVAHGPRAIRLARVALADVRTCPAGHVNRVEGRWGCRCGAQFVGHAFAPCRVCGSVAGWFPCADCGLAVRS